MQEKYIRCVLGIEYEIPGYLVKIKAGRRAWNFEKRRKEGKGSKLARECWKEMKERRERGKVIRMGEGKAGIF